MKKYIILILVLIVIILIGIIIITLSKNKKEIKSIKLLEYGYSDGRMINGNVLYKLECNGTCILTSKLAGYPDEETFKVEIEKKDYYKIIKLLQDNNVSAWDGFNKSDKHVLDGTSYHFKVITKDDVTINASGYMKYPKKFNNVINEIIKLFNKANDTLCFKLFDHDLYKDFNINNVTRIIEDYYSEAGIESKEYTDKDEIMSIYEKFQHYKLGIETKMSCDDNTKKYKFIVNNGKEYLIEEECNMIVINNKRYIPTYIK